MDRFVAALLIAAALLLGSAQSAQAQPTTGDTAEIVMYVMPQCGYCERARQYLQARGLNWREVDIAASAEGKAEFDARGGVGTPLIVIGTQQVTGYNVARMDQLLN